MMTRIIAAFAAPLAALAFLGCAYAQITDPTHPDAVVTYGGPDPLVIETAAGPVEFIAEIADTPDSRQRGMMFRESMAPDAAMLFDFEVEQPVAIWMANTLISLDIIFVRADGTIAKIIAHAQPLSRRSLPSDFPVLGVIEIAGGRAGELGIAPGDLVRHPLFGTWETGEAAAEAAPEPADEADADESLEEDADAPVEEAAD
ncbi:MAG: DUF192 domain-containing protein [Glycocaulis sp.]